MFPVGEELRSGEMNCKRESKIRNEGIMQMNSTFLFAVGIKCNE